MCRKLILSIGVVLLLGLAGELSAADLVVPEGDEHIVSGDEYYDRIEIAGTLKVPAGTSLTAIERSLINGPGAQIIVNGGSVLLDAWRSDLGQGSDGYIHLNGGTFTVTGLLTFPDNVGGVHCIYLNDGVMHCGEIDFMGERDALMYVGGGVLRLDEGDPQEWLDEGWLLPSVGYDCITIEYIPASPYTEVRAFLADPYRASNPSPENYAEEVPLDAHLTWQGPAEATYDVYLGTDPWNLVQVSTGQSATSYDPGLLNASTLYYWKVNSIVDGEIHESCGRWRFTTQPRTWTNADPVDDSWCTPGNWTGNAVPGPDEVAFISPPPSRGPVIAPGCNANPYQIQGPVWESADEQVMDITGGTLTVEDNWRWSFSDVPGYMPEIPPDIVRGKATINITGSPVITINGIDTANENYHVRGAELGTGIINICGDPAINVPNGFFRGGDKQDSRYIVNMKGGTVNCWGFLLGDEGQCDLNLSYGTINVENDFNLVCRRGEPPPHHTVNITGGTINVGGTFRAIEDTQGTTTINLDCGTIECAAFDHDKEYTMDIEDGVLIIHGDATLDIQDDIDAGYITAFGGTDSVDNTYDPITNKTTVKAASSTGCTPTPPPCTTPQVDTGGDIQICPQGQMLTVVKGTATDPEGDPLQYRWLERNAVVLDWTAVGANGEAYLDLATLPPLSLGGHVLTLDATDGQSTVSEKMILTVVEECCADILVRAAKHTIGSGANPGSTKEPLVGITVCAYDKSDTSCARTVCGGISHQHYQCILDNCTPVNCAVTDENGEATINLPAGDYVIISDDATKTVLPDPLGVSASNLACGELKQKYLQQIVKADGKKVPARTTRRTGSELLIIEPEFVVWDDTQQLYPFVFESVGDWGVTVAVTPPEGFV
ncbi:MAG: hypothetical protein ACYS4W_02780, partial [Planctomycetota bacterium]